jgi:hypothetical protein
MPKKTAKKSTKPAKKAAPVKKSTKPAAKPAATSESALTKKHYHKEQEDFYAAHPNAKPLLVLFMLIAIAAFIYIIQVKYLAMM